MATQTKLPDWFKVRYPIGEQARTFRELTTMMRDNQLHTICEEAHCPNIAECWGHGTATFLILGDVCTRACSYCAVASGKPGPLDPLEATKLAATVKRMGLRHVVITSVNRDDLADGGAAVFVECVQRVRAAVPGIRIELLIPDFLGHWDTLQTVLDARPDVLNHNIETVPRLFRKVRHKGDFERSIELLARARAAVPGMTTKSGMMLGWDETEDEIIGVFEALRGADVEVLTLGQYLQPSAKHADVHRFYTPEEFAHYRRIALGMGFRHVESGPLVRSSYHAHEHVA
jgi:lipoic acid synthetase